jgi:hypothetical protein
VNGESPALGRASADSRSEVESQSSEQERQGAEVRRFDPGRYPAVSVSVLQLLPESNARANVIAFALGRWLDLEGTSGKTKNGKQVSASVIDKRRLPAVLEALGNPDPSQWRRYVRDWVSRHVAHRCAPGVVCLFRLPNLSECPACKAEIRDFDLYPKPEAHKPRGPGFAGATLPPNGSNAPTTRNKHSRGLEQTLPPLSARTPQGESVSTRSEVGLPSPESSEKVQDPPPQEGSSEIAPCPECGAQSAAVGYHGHAMGCPRYYRSEVAGAA